MLVTLNGKNREFKEPLSLEDLVRDLSRNLPHVIAEINGRIIKKTDWPRTAIKNDDRIELVTFVGGG